MLLPSLYLPQELLLLLLEYSFGIRRTSSSFQILMGLSQSYSFAYSG